MTVQRVSYFPDMDTEPLSDDELDELQGLTDGATSGPWESYIEEREPIGGCSFIRMGGFDDSVPDMYVYHEDKIAPARDLDFSAAARTYLPRLLAEVRRSRDT